MTVLTYRYQSQKNIWANDFLSLSAMQREKQLTDVLRVLYRFHFPAGRMQWHPERCAVWVDAPCTCGKDLVDALGIV